MKRWCVLLLSTLGLSSSLSAADRPFADVPVLDTRHMAVVLDSRAEAAARQYALAEIRTAAEAGNSYAMYNLGSLARQSRFKDDPVVRHDPGAALMWLTRAFDAGRLTAAFKIAVTYRDLGDSLEAMAWLQAYNYYMKGGDKPLPDARLNWLRRGHVADLMAKLQDDLKGADPEAIRLRTIALLERHGTRFESALRTPTPDVSECRMKRPPKGFRAMVVHPVESSVVEIVAVVDPDGSARDVHIMDSTPDAMSANAMRQYGFRVFCPPQDAAGERVVFVTWNFVNYSNTNQMRR